MLKKLTALIVSSAMTAGILCVFPACGDGESGSLPSVGGKEGYSLDGDVATVSWEAVRGGAGYMLQKSPSRYGEYTDTEYFEGAAKYETDDIYAYYRIAVFGEDGGMIKLLGPYSYDLETFGNSTYVYSPDDDVSEIRMDFDSFYEITEENYAPNYRGEFRRERFAALFKAGEYNLEANVGYYTSLSGLGSSPDDVTISKMSVTSPVSLCNFWRTAENLSVGGDTVWAVSQATSLRRVHIKGNLALSAGDSTSGGFLADTKVDGAVTSGSQQQWLSRNSDFGSWNGGVWNMAFVGVNGNVPADGWGSGAKYTNIERSGKLREKPFLTFDGENGYRVFVPNASSSAKGISDWSNAAGKYVPLSDFYVARSDRDTADTINAALAKGKHLLLTAGIYELDTPLEVSAPDTVVMGLGLATLHPTDKNTQSLLKTADADGIIICGILLDAGKNTNTLLQVGENKNTQSHSDNPITLSDMFFRVGGAAEASTCVDACAVINGNGVIGDNFWVWRADHWYGVGWTANIAKNGIVVNGDDATFYGLFVEHFLEYQTIWNGNGGTTYFYQSELPYDVPDQNSWKPDLNTNGYASYKVSDSVTSHTAYALGVYSYLRDAAVRLDNAVECPETDGVGFHHIITVYLSGNKDSGINHVINGEGESAEKGKQIGGIEDYPLKNKSGR